MATAKTTDNTLRALVVALCRDYGRRDGLIMSDEVSRRVKNELVYINRRIFDAVAEITGATCAEAFIYDIGQGVGYARSELSYFSEAHYKSTKASAITMIAKKLYLCD